MTIAGALLLVLAGCGTRLPDSAFVAAGSGAGGSVEAGSGDDVASSDAVTGGDQAAAGPDGATTGGGTSGGGTATGSKSSTGKTATGPGAAGAANGASDVGVTANNIVVGNITSVGGALGNTVSPLLRGAQAYFAELNEKGGVNGRKITFLTCDDKEDKTRATQCAKDLIDNKKVFALVANATRAYGGAAPYVYEKGVPDILGLPVTSAYDRYPNSFSIYGNGYKRDGKHVGDNGKLYQGTGGYRWFKEKLGITKAAVFYYDIPESRQAGQFMRQGLELEGIEVAYIGGGSEQGENFANPSFEVDVANMRRAGVEAIWDAMDDTANRKLCDAMDRQGFQVKAKVSTIVAYSQSVGTNFSSPCRDSVYVTGGSRSFAETSNPRIAQFRAAMSRYQPNQVLHQWHVEGYFGAEWFVEGIKSMGANVTRAGLMKYFNSVKAYDAGGAWLPRDFQLESFPPPATSQSCFTVARWQDSAKTFVTQGPFPTCVPSKTFSYSAEEQGD